MKLLLTGIFSIIILTGSMLPAFAYTIVPPTPAFSGVSNGTANTQARFWNSNLTISHGANMLVNIFTANNTIWFNSIASGSSSGSGSYNVTQANGTTINSGGTKLNFINGTGNPIRVTGSGDVVSITISSSTSSTDIDPAPKVSINGQNRSSFTNVIANQTFPAPKVSINGNNRSSFINVIANQTFPAPKISLNGNNRSSFTGIINSTSFKANSITCTNQFISAFSNSTGLFTCATPSATVSINELSRSTFTGIIANQTFPAPKVSINTLNRSSFTNIMNTNSSVLSDLSNVASGASDGQVLTFQSSNSTWIAATPTMGSNSTTNSTVQTFALTTAFKMQNSPIFIKPQVTGNIFVSFVMGVSDNTVNGGCDIKLQFGTGAAPKTGAALTGTTIGLNETFTSATANAKGVIPIQYTVSGLTLGTSYWIEPAVERDGATSTCSLRNVMAYVTER